MAIAYAKVNPDILSWARERAQLSVAALAAKLHVAEDKLGAWEKGEKHPTFKQAQNFAARTYIPFGYLFLRQPPEESLALPDLRTLDSRGVNRVSPELIEITQIVLRRQEWYAEYLRDQGVERNPHMGRYMTNASVIAVVDDMRRALGIAPHPQRGNWEDYYRDLIHRIEKAGVLVMRQGFIGHHSRPLLVEEFRGFAIADPLAPVIFVNQTDAPAARLFTLIHELAHIWIGESGVSDTSPQSHRQEEQFCNAVAAEFLVPEDEFRTHWREQDDWRENLPALEALFRVSSLVLARRALTLKKITLEQYQVFAAELQRRYRDRARDAGGPSYFRSQKGRVSETFSRALVSEALSGRVLLRDAGNLLGMKPQRITDYARELGI